MLTNIKSEGKALFVSLHLWRFNFFFNFTSLSKMSFNIEYSCHTIINIKHEWQLSLQLTTNWSLTCNYSNACLYNTSYFVITISCYCMHRTYYTVPYLPIFTFFFSHFFVLGHGFHDSSCNRTTTRLGNP